MKADAAAKVQQDTEAEAAIAAGAGAGAGAAGTGGAVGQKTVTQAEPRDMEAYSSSSDVKSTAAATAAVSSWRCS